MVVDWYNLLKGIWDENCTVSPNTFLKTFRQLVKNKEFIGFKQNDVQECLFVAGGKIKKELSIPYRKSGCAALDMAYVAAGRYDGYFQNDLNIWDIAAGIVLIKEAGGIINDIDLFSNKNIEVIASSSTINAKLLEKINNF